MKTKEEVGFIPITPEQRRFMNLENAKYARKMLKLKNLVIPVGFSKRKQDEGFTKHHINHSFTLSIPSFIHKSVYHRLRPEILPTYCFTCGMKDYEIEPEKEYVGMLEINVKALEWLLGEWKE